MKRLTIITGIFLPLFLFGGCQTQNKKTEAETKFEQELMGLYAKVQTISNQSKTRMGGGSVLLDEQAIEQLAI